MEMDLCWITVGRQDPLKYFAKYPGRFPLVHVKDVKTLPPFPAEGGQNFGDTVDLAPVGSGMVDWKIFWQSQTRRASNITLSSTISRPTLSPVSRPATIT